MAGTTINEAGTAFGTMRQVLAAIRAGEACAGEDDAGMRYERRDVKSEDGGALVGVFRIVRSDGRVFKA
jgi:hypothetical protein